LLYYATIIANNNIWGLYMKVTTRELFCDMMEYLHVPATKPGGSGNGNITIVNNNASSRVRKPEPTDGFFVRNLLRIQMVIETVGMLLGVIHIVPPMVRPFNYPMHARALSTAKQYRLDNPIKGELKDNQAFTANIVEKYTNIASQNCARAKKLLVAGTAFTGAAVVHELVQPSLPSLPKFIATKLPNMEKITKLASSFLSGLGIGAREAKIAMGVSAAFGLMSAAWHTLRTPSLAGEGYHEEIRKKACPSK